MIVWDTMRTLKGMDEMGFRDLKLFNIMMHRRQVWLLKNHMNTLCFRVLSAKLFFWRGMYSTRRRLINPFTLGKALLLRRRPLKTVLVGKLRIVKMCTLGR